MISNMPLYYVKYMGGQDLCVMLLLMTLNLPQVHNKTVLIIIFGERLSLFFRCLQVELNTKHF